MTFLPSENDSLHVFLMSVKENINILILFILKHFICESVLYFCVNPKFIEPHADIYVDLFIEFIQVGIILFRNAV